MSVDEVSGRSQWETAVIAREFGNRVHKWVVLSCGKNKIMVQSNTIAVLSLVHKWASRNSRGCLRKEEWLRGRL